MNLYFDELVKVWRRTYIRIDADTKEEAIEKFKCGDMYYIESDILHDTESTAIKTELYNKDTDELIYEKKRR